jgi:hypothetical protein
MVSRVVALRKWKIDLEDVAQLSKKQRDDAKAGRVVITKAKMLKVAKDKAGKARG